MTSAMRKVATQSAEQTIAGAVAVSGTARRLLSTATRALTAFGAIALAALVVMFFKPELADRLQALSPFTSASAAVAPEDGSDVQQVADAADDDTVAPAATDNGMAIMPLPVAMPDADIQQQRITQWLSKRYRVSGDAIHALVSAAYATGQQIHFDPLLILAVIAIESRFNPFAESPVGAQGLMQIMAKVHHDKFQSAGGSRSALNPVVNIKVGAMILKDYVKSGGSVEAGLKRYVGAGDMASDDGYGAKVLGEYDRLKAVAGGKRLSPFVPMTPRQTVAKTVAVKAAANPANKDASGTQNAATTAAPTTI